MAKTLTRFSLDDPRILAAMKITGITARDIKPAPNTGKAGDEKDSRLADLAERKRQALVQDLEATADALDDTDVEALLQASSRMRFADQSVWERDKEKIDKQQEKLKADIQKDILRDIERLRAQEMAAQALEKDKEQLKAAHNEKMQEAIKRAEAKQAKIEEKQAAAEKAERAKRREIAKRIQESNERIEKQVEEKHSHIEARKQERCKKFEEAAKRCGDAQTASVAERLKLYEKSRAEDEERDVRVAKRNQDIKDKLSEKQEASTVKQAVVQEKLQQQAQDCEANFLQKCEKLTTAQQQVEQTRAELAEKTRAKREKDFNKYNTNRQARRLEYRKKIAGLRAELATDKGQEIVQEHLKTTSGKTAEWRETFKSFVDQNKARITRSEECAREQMISKIEATKQKTDALLEQKKRVLEYRTGAVRSGLLERQRVGELKGHLGNGSLKHANVYLEEFGLPTMTSILPEVKADDKDKNEQ